MGNKDHEETQRFPESSSVYWVGDGICTDRIINGANKIDNTNCPGGTNKCRKWKKRDEWVKYLLDKMKTTKENDTDNMTFDAMINVVKTQVYTSKDDIQRTVTITKNPDDTWATEKKRRRIQHQEATLCD